MTGTSDTGADGAARGIFGLGGQVARDLAAIDWTSTALGPVEQWPAALGNTVRLMLASRFAMWMGWGPDLIFFCNDAYRRDTLGAKYPWALGRPAAEVWSEIWDAIGSRVERVVGAGEATWDEALQLFLERSGYVEETYHTFSYSPLTDDTGATVGLFCTVSEDTGRVVAERRMATLRDLGGRLSQAVTEAEVAAAAGTELARNPYDVPFALGYDHDGPDTATLAWSTGAEPGSAWAPAAVGAGEGRWSSVLFPADRADTVVVDLDDAGGAPPCGGWDRPPTQAVVVPLAQPGERTPYGRVLIGTNPFRPLDDEYLGFLGLLAVQIAASMARARAFDDERRRVEQLAELDRAKTTFFTNISHELRTPLTLLLGPAEDALADARMPLAPVHRRRLEVVQRNSERLLKLVNTLLDFSRLQSGRTQARYEALDVARFTVDLAEMFRSAFERVGLTLTVDCPPPHEPVWVDREMWSKIVLNLLSNALKATFDGGVTVALDDDPDGHGLRLRVIDTGIGIPAAEQQRLFERFHRVTGAALRSHEGSGIGLALVAELTALHGGEVSVNSAPGEGSAFSVVIPYGSDHLPAERLHDGGPDDDTVPTEAAEAARFSAGYLAEANRWLAPVAAAEGAAHDGRPRVLVVDDNADMRDYISELLSHDYTVDTAADGEAARERVAAQPPSLVLTDVMMPRLDGFGLLAALRADSATMHIPVVMLSARSGDEATVEGLEAGADDYLVKPFSARELLARVRANLEFDRVRRLVRELQRSRDLLVHAEQMARLGSWEVDLATDRLVMSDEVHRILGLDPEAVDRHGLDWTIDRAVPRDGDRLREALQVSISDGKPLDIEISALGAADEPVLLRLRAAVVLDDDGSGEPRRVLRGSTQDITEQRAAELAVAAAAADRQAADREHAIAEELQRSLLPAVAAESDHLDIATYYRAGVEGTQVGGDWYDVIDLGAGQTALVLGDVMGRGVKAAAVMGQLRAAVRAYARLDVTPVEMLHLLDATVRDIAPDTIVTCVYAVYEPGRRELTCASAGHLPVLLTRPGNSPQRITADGPPLGAGAAYTARAPVTLDPGSTLTLFTDGLVERRGDDLGDGVGRLEQLLTDSVLPVQDLPGHLVDRLLPDGPDDDVALLIARVAERARDDRSATIVVGDGDRGVGAARDAAVDAVLGWGASESTGFDVQLIVSELVTNALRHGAAPVTLSLRRTGRRLHLEVGDNGAGIVQRRIAAPTDEGGRGLQLVAALAQRWGTRSTPPGKSVWCTLDLG